MKVLIVGGGIGGLTAALCCLHFGHEVVVFERADTLGEIGAGIQVPPNAMKVFEALGLEDEIANRAFRPQAIETRMGVSGRPIFTIPLDKYAVETWGSPYLHIHRADYIDVLKRALLAKAPHSLKLNAAVSSYAQDIDNISVKCEDGTVMFGDVLIGADGIKSVIREQMLGAEQSVFTGNVAWRAVVPASELKVDLPNPTACAWMGRGRHCVTYYLRGGELVNFVGVVERDGWEDEGWSIKADKNEALKEFEGWHPVVQTILNAVKPESLYKWALFDRVPLDQWVDGRAVLLGDAAHPMLPFLAQGAAMAVEDSWVLAHELSNADTNLPESLKAYRNQRFDRTRKAQLASRKNMGIFHQASSIGQLKTYGPMWLAGKLAPSIVHQRMNWLYGYDVTKG